MALRKSNVRVGSSVVTVSLSNKIVGSGRSLGPAALEERLLHRLKNKKAAAGAPQPIKTEGEDRSRVYRRTTRRNQTSIWDAEDEQLAKVVHTVRSFLEICLLNLF